MTETIIAAACRIVNDAGIYVASVPKPGRHHHIFRALKASGEQCLILPDDQGFLTSTGCFVEREEAFLIASRAGQVNRKPGGYDGPQLFSEDLW